MQLSSFKTYVKYDFKRTDKDTELVQAYNDMIKWVSSQMPMGDYKFQSYVLTNAGVEDYELPCQMVHIIHPIKLIIGSGSSDTGYPMEHLSKLDYDKLEPNPNRNAPHVGRPVAYTIFSKSILVTPVPDVATYIIEIAWATRPTELSADAATPELGEEWDEVLKWGTLERLYAGMGLFDEAQYWGSKYHIMTPSGDDIPAGLCKKLLQAETNRETINISQVAFNDL